MDARRSVAVSLAVGVLHAAVLIFVAHQLGYHISSPLERPSIVFTAGYGIPVILAALPVWLALRYRLLAPLLVLVLTTGYVLGMELTPPRPTFRDVAEVERWIDEPTGSFVVENGLYIYSYMGNAPLWSLGFLFVGFVEYAVRTSWGWLPDVPASVPRLSIPASRREAALVAAVGGLLHAAVMVWIIVRGGVTITGFEWQFLVSTVGMWVLAAVPLYLLVRHRLAAPATLLSLFVLLDARIDLTATVDSPHVLYFVAWYLLLGIMLAAGGIEYALRWLGVHRRLRSLL